MSERRRHFKIDPNMFLPDGEKKYPTQEDDHRMDTSSTKEDEDMPFLATLNQKDRAVVLDIVNGDMPEKEREEYLESFLEPDGLSSYRSWKYRKQTSMDTSADLFIELLTPSLGKIIRSCIDIGHHYRIDALMKSSTVTDAAKEAYRKWKTQQHNGSTDETNQKSIANSFQGSHSYQDKENCSSVFSSTIKKNIVAQNNLYFSFSIVPRFLNHLDGEMREAAESYLFHGQYNNVEHLVRGHPQAEKDFHDWMWAEKMANGRHNGIDQADEQQVKQKSEQTNSWMPDNLKKMPLSEGQASLLDPNVFLSELNNDKRARAEQYLYSGDMRNLEKFMRDKPRAKRFYDDWKWKKDKLDGVAKNESAGSKHQVMIKEVPGQHTNEYGSASVSNETGGSSRSYAEIAKSSVSKSVNHSYRPTVGDRNEGAVSQADRFQKTNENNHQTNSSYRPNMFGASRQAAETSSKSSVPVSDRTSCADIGRNSSGFVRMDAMETVSAKPAFHTTYSDDYGKPPGFIRPSRSDVSRTDRSTSGGPAVTKKSNHLNILVLGETGVGKSTFINGLVNYLKYNSMQEALNGGVEVLIESAFALTDDQFKSHKISCTSTVSVEKNGDSNENTFAGQSATQDPKSYVFSCGSAGEEKKIRLIDTPGIGDTRGPDQDKINFDKILSFISKYGELHAVCILIKPNTARLTVAFRFCIDELLVHLHKSASKNILFCFTNTRGTLYKPGDTLPTLREHLKNLKDKTNVDIPINKSTVFCFDNESFRFLCALKHGFPFTETDVDNFAASWKQSVQETEKMMASIVQLPVHSTRDTISLNNTRKLIIALARPLGEMAKTQLINKQMLEEKTDEILRSAEAGFNLKGQLYVHQTILVTKELTEPQTVCTSPSCVESVQISPESHARYTNFKTVCHQNCRLSGVQAQIVPNNQLIGCAAFTGGKCKQCGCGWETHMHVTYNLEPRVTMVIDRDVEASINRKDNANLTLNIFLDNEKKKNEDIEKEYMSLLKICAEFAVFMDHNSITPYFDSFAQYIDHLIREEVSKAVAGGTSRLSGQLKKLLHYYCHKVLSVKKSILGGSRSVKSIDEIGMLIDELGQLKYCGATVNAVKEMYRNAADQDTDDDHVVDVGNSVLGGALSKMF